MAAQKHDLVQFRLLTIGDYVSVLALWQTTEGLSLREADSEDALRRYLERNPGLSFVAEADGTLVGAVLCGHDGRRGYLHHLAVARKWRGQGIGKALVERCLEALKSERIGKCHLLVRTDNPEAVAFWRHIGWVERDDLVMMSFSSGSENA